ncbi:dihydrodipicolinate synthase family protein [Labedella endophytica]|uniref:Dihydrodipicolinate synthase family protein n=1 Tax=Labedella endophytica TaxID=1523160 RepID=A0A433JUN5_9MICO|nr:dihydrodipicolinate synthase family protein [Labedella endophytica]RUR01940.1 dihydrodipicolinate synthase family protein [Labedella endophytica]
MSLPTPARTASSTATRRDILAALPVAFHDDGSLDLDGSRRIVEFSAASGVDGAFVLGTTGEFPSLSIEERNTIAAMSVDVLGPERTVVHVGASSLHEVLLLIEGARAAGALRIAVLTPYYLPASDAAVEDFFAAVSRASDGLAVFAYLFRDRTGVHVGPELLGRLAQLPNIVGVKLSGEPVESVAAYRAAVPDDFEIFTGADRDLAKVADVGGQGVVSGISSVFPEPFVALVAALESGDPEAIAQAQLAVDDVVDTVKGDPALMKAGLALRGIDAGVARMALDTPSEQDRAELARAVASYA